MNEPRAPRAIEMLALPLIAAATGALIFGAAGRTWDAARLAAMAAAASAVLLGWPLVFWALDHGRTSTRDALILGVLLGVLPLVAAVASGLLGWFIKSGELAYVRGAVGYGAPIPYYGTIPWRTFWWWELLATAVGIGTVWLHFKFVVKSRP